jgi:hypothetical protein
MNHLRQIRLIVSLLLGSTLTACSEAGPPQGATPGASESHTFMTEAGTGLARRPAPAPGDLGKLDALPHFDTNRPRDAFQVSLSSRDLRELDLRDRLPDLRCAVFDTRTKWPTQLPEAFDPAQILAMNKTPGLRVNRLHQQGVTGRGVSIGIVDTELLLDHVEYRDRIKLYEEIDCRDELANVHGSAVASIAVGRTVGVAPEADLYYIAVGFANDSGARDLTSVAKALNRLLDINGVLSREQRIRAVSISIGWEARDAGVREITAAVERAKKEGVFVITTNLARTYRMPFYGLGREPMSDPDRMDSYESSLWGAHTEGDVLFVPMDSRVTASPTGPEDYAFYRYGGHSWVPPYLAGLYALACQVEPNLTPERFWAAALETGTPLSVASTISPEKLRQEATQRVDQALQQYAATHSPEEVRALKAQAYAQVTGKPLPEMTDGEYREWAIDAQASSTTAMARPTSGKTVDPVKLIRSLANLESDS